MLTDNIFGEHCPPVCPSCGVPSVSKNKINAYDRDKSHMHAEVYHSDIECTPSTPADTNPALCLLKDLIVHAGLVPRDRTPEELGFCLRVLRHMIRNAKRYVTHGRDVTAMAEVIRAMMSVHQMKDVLVVGNVLCMWGPTRVAITRKQLGEERWKGVIQCMEGLHEEGMMESVVTGMYTPQKWEGLVPVFMNAMRSSDTQRALAASMETSLNMWISEVDTQDREHLRRQLALAANIANGDGMDLVNDHD